MKAILQSRYGAPSSLQVKEIDRPRPRDDEVLIRVRASSLNAADVDMVRGMILIRLAAPFRPKYRIPGSDVAGLIESVGKDVTRFKAGDEVYGDLSEAGFGTFAEYVTAPEDAITHKPAELSREDAATLPSAALIALQGLRDIHHVETGETVLINGAGGGMGTFAVQIAKSLGGQVTGVDSGAKLDTVRSLGADHVIDYTLEDYTRGEARYDLVLDMVGNHDLAACKQVLSATGAYVIVGGPVRRFLRAQLQSATGTQGEGQRTGILMWKPNRAQDVDDLKQLVVAGTVRPVIDRGYSLDEVPAGLADLEAGHVIGKAVVSV